MNLNLTIAIIILIVQSSCTSMRQLNHMKRLTRSSIIDKRDSFFTYSNLRNKITLPVLVDNTEEVEMIFDTGASTTIDEELAKRLHKPSKGFVFKPNTSGTNVHASKAATNNLTYSFMGSVFTLKMTGQQNFGSNFNDCLKSQGVIGSDIFKHMVLYLNPTVQRMGILFNCSDSLMRSLSAFHKIRIMHKPIQKIPMTNLALGNMEFKAIIDYGSNMDLLILYNPDLHQQEIGDLLKQFPVEKIRGVRSIGVTVTNMHGIGLHDRDSSQTYFITLDSVRLDNKMLDGPFELRLIAWRGKFILGNLGMAFMNRFESFLDYPGKALYLKRNTNRKDDSLAISPRIIFSKRYGNILGLEECALWKQHAVQFGDTVITVNGIPLRRMMDETEPCLQDERLHRELQQLRSIVIRQRNGKDVSITLPISLSPKQ